MAGGGEAALLVALLVVAAAAAPSPTTVVAAQGGSEGVGAGRGEGVAAAHSHSVGADGVVRGECAYTDSRGANVKVRYSEHPDGRVEVEGGRPGGDGPLQLAECRAASEATRRRVEERLKEVQMEMSREREVLQREWESLTLPRLGQPLRSAFSAGFQEFIP